METFRAGALETNAYVVGDGDSRQALVVDPGASAEGVLSFLQDRRFQATAIVNTHGHYDHVTGNRVLQATTGAPIMIHAADAALAQKAAALALLVSDNAENSPPADVILEEGSEIRSGGLVFRVIHTPGHTPGGITLAGHGLLFCGDLLRAGAIGTTGLPGCSRELLLQSIRLHILSRPDETGIRPGHGPFTTVGEEREFLTRLLSEK